MTRPDLARRRVLVTRDAEHSARWAEQLAEHGASPVILPCVHSEPIQEPGTLERLRAALPTAEWLLFTSARAVAPVEHAGVALAANVRLAAVGRSTAEATRRLDVGEPFVARGGTSLALGEELVKLWGDRAPSQHVLVIGAEGGRDDAERELTRAGARVTRIDVYRTVPAPAVEPRRDLALEGIDDILLASPSAVTGLLNQARVAATTRCYTIGPTTSAAAVAAGLVVTGEATTPDLDGLMEAMQ